MKVIDVSDWNDNIDWSTILDAGVKGVVVKSLKAALFQNSTANRSLQLWPVA